MMSSSVFQDKAEQLPTEFIDASPVYCKGLYEGVQRAVKFLFDEKIIDVYYVLGPRGIGKTFHVIKALRDMGISFSLNAYNQDKREFEKLYNADGDVIILDDFHYICEDAKKGLIGKETPTIYLVKAFQGSKPVIVVSEKPLNYYAECLNDERFIECTSETAWRLIEAEAGDINSYMELVRAYSPYAGIETKAAFLLYETSRKPRLLVRALNRFYGKLTLENILSLLDIRGLDVERLREIIPNDLKVYFGWGRKLASSWGNELKKADRRLRHLEEARFRIQNLQDNETLIDHLYEIYREAYKGASEEAIEWERRFTLLDWSRSSQEKRKQLYGETKEAALQDLARMIKETEKRFIRALSYDLMRQGVATIHLITSRLREVFTDKTLIL